MLINIMSGILLRIVADDFTKGQIRTICRCRQCSLESIENSYYREVCHNGTFCKKCISSCQICPSQKGPIPYLQQLLKNVKVKCINCEWGCTSILPFDLLASHEAGCNFNKHKWPNAQQKAMQDPLNLDPNQPKGKSQKVSFMNNIGNDSFPYMDFVSQDAIQFPVDQEDHNLKYADLEKRIKALESNIPNNEGVLTSFKQEISKRFEECEKSMEESLKQFCEKYIVDRDFLWNGICNTNKKIVYLEEEIKSIKLGNSQPNIPGGFMGGKGEPSMHRHSPYLNFEQLEAVNLKETQEKANQSNLLKYETIAQKVAFLSNQFYEITKHLCSDCSSLPQNIKNTTFQQLCSTCSSLICSDCLNKSKCMKCGKLQCLSHSYKCKVCDNRACKDAGCVGLMKQCNKCGQWLCNEHINIHMKLEEINQYKISCSSKEMILTNELNGKSFSEITSILQHIRGIKELQIKNSDVINLSFIQCLTQFNSLETLKLPSNNINDAIAGILSFSIEALPNIALLDLEGNKIGDTGIMSICSAFLKNTKLQELNFSRNTFGDLGMGIVISTCKELKSIKKVYLKENRISEVFNRLLADWQGEVKDSLLIDFK